jgi:microcystin-dependent protein
MKSRTNFTIWAVALLVTATVSMRPSAYGGAQPYIGEIMWVPYTFAPNGWANCNGQLMSIAQNTALFSLLGTTYGGDGKTTFALPDMRGRSDLHAGQGPGLSNYFLGESGGQENVTLPVSTLPPHNHSSTTTGHAHATPPLPVTLMASSDPAIGVLPENQVLAAGALGLGRGPSNLTYLYHAGPPNVALGPSASAQSGVTGGQAVTTNAAGGTIPHENRQPYLVLRCVIATEGIFPSQNGSEQQRGGR